MSEKKNSIENKLSEISKRALIFSDRERLKKGGIYIPDIFLNFVKISEIASVIKGVKPVLEFNCSCEYKYKMEQGLKELKNIYGLEYCVSSRKFLINSPKDHSEVVDINDPRRGMISCSISFQRELAERSEEYFLKKSYESEENAEFSRKFAEIMGYPDCCIDFGDKLSGNLDDPQKIKQNWIWSKAHIRSFMNSDKISRFLNIYVLPNILVPHVPCNLNCQPSREYAQKILEICKKEDDHLSDLVEYFLDCHSLFWYYSEFIFLRGEKENNFLRYSEFLPFSLSAERFYGDLSADFQEKFQRTLFFLEKGNIIQMKDDCFQVYNNDILVGTIKKDYKFECILF